MTTKKFTGFEPPQQNWSRLPHALIDQLPEMSGAELKVVLYILRHTWGYQDNTKRITVDEFVNGRKRADDTRIDGGCGLSSVTSVRSALKDAEDHGYIIVETDDSDQARIKKFYSLNIAQNSDDQFLIPTPAVPNSDDQKMIPGDQKMIIGGSKNDHRTEKETLERNSGKEVEGISPRQQPRSLTTPAPPPLAEPTGDPYMDAAVNKWNRRQQGRAAHPGQIPMDDWNKQVPKNLRMPLVGAIADLTGKRPLWESDDVKTSNLLHEAAIKAHKWGYTPDSLIRLEEAWINDWRSGGKRAGRIDQFMEFLSEKKSESAPPPTTLQPQRRVIARGGYAWS